MHYVPSIASLSEELNSNVDITAFVPKFVIAHEQLHAEKVAHATAIHSAQRQKRRAQQARRNGGGNDVAISAPTPSAVPQEEQVRACAFARGCRRLRAQLPDVSYTCVALFRFLTIYCLVCSTDSKELYSGSLCKIWTATSMAFRCS